MTDISDLREGGEIEAVVRLTVASGTTQRVAAGEGGARMTTQTRVLPELDEALDFDPTCTIGHNQSPHGLWYADPCEARASWVAILSCCGQARLGCESHKVRYTEHPALSTRWACVDCGAWWLPDAPASERFSRIERIR